MVRKAIENAAKTPYRNVEFRLGEIENLPDQDSSVDVVISNCVINLVPDKERAFKEAFRVLRPGGRLMVSDLVLEKPLPAAIKEDVEAYVGCIGGALVETDYLESIRRAGFEQVHVVSGTVWSIGDEELGGQIQKSELGQRLLDKLDGNVVALADARRSVKSIKVSAFKPAAS
jgi:SAM-dependent methyltransferase